MDNDNVFDTNPSSYVYRSKAKTDKENAENLDVEDDDYYVYDHHANVQINPNFYHKDHQTISTNDKDQMKHPHMDAAKADCLDSFKLILPC